MEVVRGWMVRSNGAIDLDGSNDYLAIKDLHYSQSGQIPAVSISVWFKTTKSTEAYIVSYDGKTEAFDGRDE